MRFAPFVALIAGVSILAVTAYEAEAQTRRDRPRVFIQKRSYLDPGTEVKPLSQNFHSHIYDRQALYPTLGPLDVSGASRWPLPLQFELPNFR